MKAKQNDIEKVAKLIKGIRFAMITTVGRGGTLRSRPMTTQNQPFDGTLWFFADGDSHLIHEADNNPRVNVSYADVKSNRFVSVSGRAAVVRDKDQIKAMWNPEVKAWFPKGPADPRIALLRVAVSQVEYWDAPSSKMVVLYEYAKAMVTGRRPQGFAEHKTVKLNGRATSARRRTRGRVARR